MFLLAGSVHGGGKGMVDCTVGICGGGVMVVQDVDWAGARGKAISLREPAFADEGQGYIPQRAAFVDPLLLASPTC